MSFCAGAAVRKERKNDPEKQGKSKTQKAREKKQQGLEGHGGLTIPNVVVLTLSDAETRKCAQMSAKEHKRKRGPRIGCWIRGR